MMLTFNTVLKKCLNRSIIHFCLVLGLGRYECTKKREKRMWMKAPSVSFGLCQETLITAHRNRKKAETAGLEWDNYFINVTLIFL